MADDSPYLQFEERIGWVYGELLENPLAPEDVARAIRHAIETDDPRLRHTPKGPIVACRSWRRWY